MQPADAKAGGDARLLSQFGLVAALAALVGRYAARSL